MDFSFTEEQTLLRNMVQGFLQDKYDFETRRKIVASDEGWSKDFWQEWAELGLLAAPFSEEQGGMGGGGRGQGGAGFKESSALGFKSSWHVWLLLDKHWLGALFGIPEVGAIPKLFSWRTFMTRQVAA